MCLRRLSIGAAWLTNFADCGCSQRTEGRTGHPSVEFSGEVHAEETGQFEWSGFPHPTAPFGRQKMPSCGPFEVTASTSPLCLKPRLQSLMFGSRTVVCEIWCNYPININKNQKIKQKYKNNSSIYKHQTE